MDVYRWNDVNEEQLNPLVTRRVIHGSQITVARLKLAAGAVVPMHQHVNEQISMIEYGRLRFVIGGVEQIAEAGDAVRIPPDVPHTVTAEIDSLAVDLFSPIREDWIRGDDAYLRK
jgi:quercetin dioxygenase-like cupin family protein